MYVYIYSIYLRININMYIYVSVYVCVYIYRGQSLSRAQARWSTWKEARSRRQNSTSCLDFVRECVPLCLSVCLCVQTTAKFDQISVEAVFLEAEFSFVAIYVCVLFATGSI
jgi:hypothetical protein